MSKRNDSPNHFIRSIISNDLTNGKNRRVYTRFPPEPNGYLHLGHAKSICLNFGMAKDMNGRCNLRFDDTNPEKESTEYMESIRSNVQWLGFKWNKLCYASDYFEYLYEFAVQLINKELAYVDDLSFEQMREYRGTLTEAGKDSPNRNRSVEQSLDLFQRMRNGEFEEGNYVLRAKIDMAAPNMVMRDPILYRIRYAHHYRAGDKWCIYPLYDFTHCISDALEGITHSLCTLEFQDNRELYDWILSNIDMDKNLNDEPADPMPRQIEFGRLNLKYTVLSKRKLIQLVEQGHVNGWDDPRMPTLAGIRRRGYTPNSIKTFCNLIGITRKDSLIEMTILENAIRGDLESSAKRVFGVLKPLKVVLTNYPAEQSETFKVKNHPKDDSMGTRALPFSRELYIDRDDFMLDPPDNFFRLSPGKEVRLRYGYAITCDSVIEDADGNITELHCHYDPFSAKGKTADGRKIKGIIHWVNVGTAVNAKIRVYDRLFNQPNPASEEDFINLINPDSLHVYQNGKIEASVFDSIKNSDQVEHFQFERVGYFCFDSVDSSKQKPVLNRTVSLRDTWAKLEKS